MKFSKRAINYVHEIISMRKPGEATIAFIVGSTRVQGLPTGSVLILSHVPAEDVVRYISKPVRGVICGQKIYWEQTSKKHMVSMIVQFSPRFGSLILRKQKTPGQKTPGHTLSFPCSRPEKFPAL